MMHTTSKIVGISEAAELKIGKRTVLICIESIEIETTVDSVIQFADLSEAVATSEHLYMRATILK